MFMLRSTHRRLVNQLIREDGVYREHWSLVIVTCSRASAAGSRV
jgi:hypothetical protein